MKKECNILIICVIILFSFIINMNHFEALNQCNINYNSKDIKGYGSMIPKYTEMTASQSANIYIDSPSGNSDFSLDKGWGKSSQDIKREFSIYYAAKKSGKKIGVIKTLEMIFYDSNDNQLCEITEKYIEPNGDGETPIGQQYAVFDFNVVNGEISYIKVSGTYEYDGKPNEFETKTFRIGKILGKNGTTVNNSSITTQKITAEDATPDGAYTEKADYLQGNSPNEEGYDPSKSDVRCSDISTLVNKYWQYVMILAPVVLILLITIDFVKALTTSDAEQLKKSANTALKRTISTVILLILPELLSVILKWFSLELCLY